MKRWSDLEFVLAVAKEGSAAGAARLLNVNHATVIRRIQKFESRWPEPVFEHRRDGYRLTEKGNIFLEAAENIEKILLELERNVIGGEQELSGHVRITTTDSLFPILSQEVMNFRDAYPGITLDLTMSNQRLDLFNRDADIAIRPSNHPPPDLIGRRIGMMRFGAYGQLPFDNGNDLSKLPWLALSGPLLDSPVGQKITKFIGHFNTVARADSFVGLRLLAEAGMGCTFLPRPLGDESKQLTRLTPDPLPMDVDLWLLTHKDILRAQRIRVCVDYLYDVLKARFQVYQ